ncbi:MAG: T9SS type A sorting domain-containing protein [Bacteroidia bacterium]
MIAHQKAILIIIISLLWFGAEAQKRNSIWCFGDSAGIDFNGGIPSPINTSLDTRGSCVSIADTNGQLLFYANTRAATAGQTTGLVWNRNHQLMLNGDSIAGDGWYDEMIIIPNPADDSLYYLFSIGIVIPFGLEYSIIDMRGDGTLGGIIQKNFQLQTFKMVDCLTAIKHGNGRDWWLIFRESPVFPGTDNNSWYSYLITPSGISNVTLQNVGTLNSTNAGSLCFNPSGNKICFVNTISMIEIYDFDRCTGTISNPVNIEPEVMVLPYPYYWSCAFSPNGQYLYVSGSTTPSTLWQFDTWAANIDSTKTLLWQVSYPPYTAGALKLAPDNKIYMSCAWSDSVGNFNYPYPDSAFYLENMNLGVINSPDAAGMACDFQPWSFYLDGKRTYWGLPNNPDYELGAVTGNICDSLTGIKNNEQIIKNELFVYYNSPWQKAFINAKGLKGRNVKMSAYDLLGNVIYTEERKLSSQYFTKDLNMAAFAKGMYIVNLVTEKERLVKKFIKD